MPRDVYIFLLLLAVMIGWRFLLRAEGVEIRPGVALFVFAVIVVAQIAFLLTGFRRRRPPGKG